MAKQGTKASLPRRQMGRYLRESREEQNLTQGQIAAIMDWSVSTQSRLERGDVGRLRARDIELLCQNLGFDDEKTAAMVGLFKQGAEKSWWHSFGDLIPERFNVYIGLEASARHIEIFRPDIIPGLLQTTDYAATLDRTYFPKDSEEERQRRIELKTKRQAIITRRANPATLDVILYEAALNPLVGSPKIMAAQHRHLADLSTRPNVTIRMLPFSAGFPVGGPVGPFSILDYGLDAAGSTAEPTVIYVEGFTGDMYLEAESDLRRYREALTIIRHNALDAVASRTLLRQRMKEYLA
ncbi:Scr1 family TA system antitoxin-like transcriptional regulator [Nocardia sp. R6R-6]|uniref:Scr1 family TA system antitoxin-like transcriptional regulator n=1 Tax=Nocardia sp. R6R-6 TaxID=3459303 RepID=UPI00403E2733